MSDSQENSISPTKEQIAEFISGLKIPTPETFLPIIDSHLNNFPENKKIFLSCLVKVGYKDHLDFLQRFIFKDKQFHHQVLQIGISLGMKGKQFTFDELINTITVLANQTSKEEEDFFDSAHAEYLKFPEKEKSICEAIELLHMKLLITEELSIFDNIPDFPSFIKEQSILVIPIFFERLNKLYNTEFIPREIIDYMATIETVQWQEAIIQPEIQMQCIDESKIMWTGTEEELINKIDSSIKNGTLIDPLNRQTSTLPFYFFNVIGKPNSFGTAQPLKISGREKDVLIFFGELITERKLTYGEITPDLIRQICYNFRKQSGEEFNPIQLGKVKSSIKSALPNKKK